MNPAVVYIRKLNIKKKSVIGIKAYGKRERLLKITKGVAVADVPLATGKLIMNNDACPSLDIKQWQAAVGPCTTGMGATRKADNKKQ